MPNKSSPALTLPTIRPFTSAANVTSRVRSGVAAPAVQPLRRVRHHRRVRGVEERHDLVRVAVWLDRSDGHTRHVLAAILTIGNELVSGDTENTNASWLARRLETLGVKVVISAAVPDEIERIVDFVQRERARVDHLLVTGGLGGTPDDLTREALAAAFEVAQEVGRSLPTTCASGSAAIPSTRRGGRRSPRARDRSTTRSAGLPASRSRTPGCCRGSRAR